MNPQVQLAGITQLAEQGRLRSSLEAARDAYEEARSGPVRSLAAYNLGALYWGEIGDGVSARPLFEETFRLCQRAESVRERTLAANAAENLMLLSLSFEECETWAEHLRRLVPNEPVLQTTYEAVRDARSQGHPWWGIMNSMAARYYDKERSRSVRRHGCAASILQLMLTHREALRLPWVSWRGAVILYGTMLLLVCGDCDGRMRDAFGKTDAEEVVFIMQAAGEQIQTYLGGYPNDGKVRSLHNSFHKLRAVAEQLRTEGKNGVLPGNRQGTNSEAGLPLARHVSAAVLGGLVGGVLSTEVGVVWSAIVGVTTWLAALEVVKLIRRRHTTEAASGPVRTDQRMSVGNDSGIGQSPSYQSTADGAKTVLVWQKSARLVRAMRKVGLEACRFRLVQLDVTRDWQDTPIVMPPGSVVLTFQPEQPVPESKWHAAGLALRCIVGLTFPNAVQVTTGLTVGLRSKARYLLGDGVPIGNYILLRGADRVGPLQFRGTEECRVCRVYITLASSRQDGSVSDEAVVLLMRVMPETLRAFEPLKSVPVVFCNDGQ